MDLVDVIDSWTSRLAALAWSMLLLTWTLAWTLRGAPIPSSKVKRLGNALAEDAIWAALWLALGSTVFTVIVKLADIVAKSLVGG